MLVLGVSSGTSMDGIDTALVEISSSGDLMRLSLVTDCEEPWPGELRERLDALAAKGSRIDPGALAALSSDAGEAFAAACQRTAESAGLSLEEVDLVASHGQTVRHLVDGDGRVRGTLQLGQPAVIAERTGCTVAADFRQRDIAAGGQGAPLVSFLDALLLGDAHEHRAIQNIGGVANVTFVPRGSPRAAIAFDTGPGNAVLDGLARRLLGLPYDHDGRAARAGTASEALLTELLADSYFRRPPPKSVDRERFGAAYADRLDERGTALALSREDVMATATQLTARSLARAYREHLPAWPDAVYLSGGGADNPVLVEAVAQALTDSTPAGAGVPALRRVEALGLPAGAKEAIAFAVLGHEALHGRPNTLPACTGARRAVCAGGIWPGRNHERLLRSAAHAARASPAIDRIVLEATRTTEAAKRSRSNEEGKGN